MPRSWAQIQPGWRWRRFGGGNLAAVVSQLARDNRTPCITFQLLWYPATTYDTTLPSFTENASAPIIDREALAEVTFAYAAGST